MDRKEQLEKDIKDFEMLGIIEGKPFELVELGGYWIVDCINRRAYYYNCESHLIRGVNRYYTPGVYEHILDGTWHRKEAI